MKYQALSRALALSAFLPAASLAGCSDLVIPADDPVDSYVPPPPPVDASEMDGTVIDEDGGVVLVAPASSAHFTHAVHGDAYRTLADATNYTGYVYLDLDTGAEVTPSDPSTDATWDIAFKRSEVYVNGGISGGSIVEGTRIEGAALADVTVAPASGYVTDAVDGADDDSAADLVFSNWYAYNPMTHVLTPENRTYVVHTTAGAYVKIRFVAYYDNFGTSGRPSFDWFPVAAP